MEIITTLDNIKSTIHTHSNKSILDNTTASFTTALKTKLDGIETGANKTIVDASLSSTSTNPIQNKAIYTALNSKADEQLPMEITTTEGDIFRSVGDAIIGINDAMLIMASEMPNYNAATSSALGLVKIGSDTVQSTAANSVTSTSSRTYAVQKNSNDQLVVNVPWAGANMKISFYGYVNVGSSTHTSFTKYSSNSLSGGTYGRVYNIFTKSQGSGGGISVQKKATYYTDYDCVAQATANSNFWISLTVFVPANTTYYLYYMLVTNCYWNSFSLTTA